MNCPYIYGLNTKAVKSEQKKTNSVCITSNKRLKVWRNLKAEVTQLKDSLVECK